MTSAAEAAYLAIRHEYARRGRPLPDEPWTRILAQAAVEAAGPVIAAGERDRIRSLLPYHVPCCENFLASVGDLVNEHEDTP